MSKLPVFAHQSGGQLVIFSEKDPILTQVDYRKGATVIYRSFGHQNVIVFLHNTNTKMWHFYQAPSHPLNSWF
jgi:hypothetical protein